MKPEVLSGSWQGSYQLVRELGRGGMGVVWEAWDERLQRRVAVKMLHPYLFADKHVGERLLEEARLAARIEHPNVVRIYRVDMHEGRMVIEMQYVDGEALPSVLRMGPLPGNQAADLLAQVLSALSACHAQDVIHCDLKPGNLLVSVEGQVFLTDFGIARALCAADTANPPTPATSGPLWGTPQYSPPEAWKGDPPSPSWDLYAAGLIVYESLSGESPYQGRTPLAVMLEKHTKHLAPIEESQAGLSPKFAALINDLIASEASDRPESAQAALRRLAECPEYRQRSSNTEPIRPMLRKAIESPVTPSRSIHTHAKTGALEIPRTTAWNIAGVAMVLLLILLTAGTLYWSRGPAADPAVEMALADPDLGKVNWLAVNSDRAVFSYNDGIYGRELWCVNSTGQPWIVQDLNPGPAGSFPRHLTSWGTSSVLFSATTADLGAELWDCATVTAEARLRLIKDIIPGPLGSDPHPVLAPTNTALFYATTIAQGRELWVTNGREAQTAPVADFQQGHGDSQPMGPVMLDCGDHAYLVMFTSEMEGQTLVRYDYDSASYKLIAPVDANHLAEFNGKFYFNNRTEENGRELWVYDPVTDTMALFVDIVPGSGSSNPAEFKVWNNGLYFQAATELHGTELWRSDGTVAGTNQLTEIFPGSTGSYPFGFVETGEKLYFKATSEQYGMELYVATAGGVNLVHDLNRGTASSTPYNMSHDGGWLFFSSDDGKVGEELWMLDTLSPSASPKLVVDLLEGPDSSGPHMMRWTSGGLGYFTATNALGLRPVYRIRHSGGECSVEELELPVPVGWEAPG